MKVTMETLGKWAVHREKKYGDAYILLLKKER